MFRKINLAVLLGMAALVASMNQAQAVLTLTDPATIITTAETSVTAVAALVAATVGFFVVVKIVKWVRK